MVAITAESAAQATSSPGIPVPRAATPMPRAARPKGWDAAITIRLDMARAFTPPRKSPIPQVRLAPSASSAAPKLNRHRSRRRDGIELVRVVEDCRLGGAGSASVVMAGDGVQQLGG